jgi:putative hemolysin
MPPIFFELAIILLLILTNGVLAMSETALIASRKVRLQQRAEADDPRARVALELARAPSRFLSTVQIGITLIGILAGAFSGATVAEEMEAAFGSFPLLAPYAEAISVAIVVVVITYLSLVFGELVPKQIALNDPERVAASLAPSMRFLSRIASPLVHLLSISSKALLRLLKARSASEPEITEEEIRILIGQGTQAGVFEPIEEDIVDQIFRLGDLSVSALMTPRVDIDWLDLASSTEELQQQIQARGHAHFPVAQGSLDHIVGIVAAKDMLARYLAGRPLDLKAILRPAQFVPESMPAFEVVERLQQTHSQIALVLDEFGGIHGLVTTRDLLEAIVGEFPEEGKAADPDVVLREDGTWLMDGMMSTEAVRDLLRIRELPGEREHHFQTLGGFLMSYLGRIPKSGDSVRWGGFRFEVVDMDKLRVNKVLVGVESPTSSR